MPECGMKETSVYIKLQVWRGGRMYIMSYIYNLRNREWASVFNALFKTRPVSAFAFLRGLNIQLLQSRNWFAVCRSVYIYIYLILQGLKNSC